ncbi:MAG: hypothetical protein WCV62_00035 [Candidatus Peribacteraceae bacterium]|jgi:hypothetical protein
MRSRCFLLLVPFLLTACTASALKGTPLPAGSFSLDSSDGGGTGTAYVRGYAVVNRVQEPFCSHDPEETDDCQAFDYVFLRIINTGSPVMDRFITQNRGNAYVGKKSVGLGCMGEGGTITYVNDSDAFGRKTYTIAPELARQILRSTVRTPVTLALTKETLSGGTEGPPCYAHFTSVQAVAAQ